MKKKISLVVFDMDGVLINEKCQLIEIAKEAGVLPQVANLMNVWRKEKRNLRFYHLKAVSFLKGLSFSKLMEVTKRLTLKPGAKETFNVLKNSNIKTALITNGYECIAGKIKKELHMDYLYANKLIFKGNKLTGKMKEVVVDELAKKQAFKEIVYHMGISLDECAVVGDGINDRLMMEVAGLKVAFLADKQIEKLADVIVRKNDLRELIPYILRNN